MYQEDIVVSMDIPFSSNSSFALPARLPERQNTITGAICVMKVHYHIRHGTKLNIHMNIGTSTTYHFYREIVHRLWTLNLSNHPSGNLHDGMVVIRAELLLTHRQFLRREFLPLVLQWRPLLRRGLT